MNELLTVFPQNLCLDNEQELCNITEPVPARLNGCGLGPATLLEGLLYGRLARRVPGFGSQESTSIDFQKPDCSRATSQTVSVPYSETERVFIGGGGRPRSVSATATAELEMESRL